MQLAGEQGTQVPVALSSPLSEQLVQRSWPLFLSKLQTSQLGPQLRQAPSSTSKPTSQDVQRVALLQSVQLAEHLQGRQGPRREMLHTGLDSAWVACMHHCWRDPALPTAASAAVAAAAPTHVKRRASLDACAPHQAVASVAPLVIAAPRALLLARSGGRVLVLGRPP